MRALLKKCFRWRWGLLEQVRWYGSGLSMLFMYLTGYLPSQALRKFIYCRVYGARIAKSAVIYGGAEIRAAKRLTIGENTTIGHGAVLDARGGLSIGRNVNFSTGVWIWTMQHDPRDPKFGIETAPVVVKDYAWLSCRSVVLPGVTVGEGSVVAAGAVVTQDVPDYSIVGGVPARVIGERPRNLNYRLGKDGGYAPFI